MLPINDPLIATIIICGMFYLVVEAIHFICYFLFQRKKFMSWWNGTPVQEDYTHMYLYTYDYRGRVVRWTINSKWLFNNPKSCFYRGEKNDE